MLWQYCLAWRGIALITNPRGTTPLLFDNRVQVIQGRGTEMSGALVEALMEAKCERRSSCRLIPKYRRHHRPINSPSRLMHLTLQLPSGEDLAITKRGNRVWEQRTAMVISPASSAN